MSADDSGAERQSDLAVMDANEYKNSRRLKAILDARETVFEARHRAHELYVQGDIGADGRNLIVLRAVRQYVEEVWTLLLDHAAELDEPEDSEWLAQRELGTIRFEQASREPVTIRGLWDYLHCESTFTATYQQRTPWRHGSDRVTEHVETQTVPVDISKRAFLTVNEFLNEVHDLDLQFEELDDSLPQRGPESVEIPDEMRPEALADQIKGPVDDRVVTDGDD